MPCSYTYTHIYTYILHTYINTYIHFHVDIKSMGQASSQAKAMAGCGQGQIGRPHLWCWWYVTGLAFTPLGFLKFGQIQMYGLDNSNHAKPLVL